ncbi:MAG: NmrA/HSCARG family protein [Rhizobiales bacterium]|nr:NmrA/HSCARG family protein [Hyphomicrobiales bacterium]
MSNTKTIFVARATGAQGGATIDALLNKGHKVIAMTRNPQSDAGKALTARGVDVRKGDYTDTASIISAAKGADAAFAVSTSFEVGPEAEIEQGKALISALHNAGVGHIVFSTVGSADKKTGIAHFDGKYEIEKHLTSLSTPSTIMAPVFFMENLTSPWGQPKLNEGIYAAGMPGDRILQQIAVKNIGDFAAALIERGESVYGKRYDIAGDAVSGEEAVIQISKAAGKTVNYQGFPAESLREQMADMFHWFNEVGYTADVAGLRKEFPDVPWLNYSQWLALQDWTFMK